MHSRCWFTTASTLRCHTPSKPSRTARAIAALLTSAMIAFAPASALADPPAGGGHGAPDPTDIIACVQDEGNPEFDPHVCLDHFMALSPAKQQKANADTVPEPDMASPPSEPTIDSSGPLNVGRGPSLGPADEAVRASDRNRPTPRPRPCDPNQPPDPTARCPMPPIQP
jgi:hypothetical protein